MIHRHQISAEFALAAVCNDDDLSAHSQDDLTFAMQKFSEGKDELGV